MGFAGWAARLTTTNAAASRGNGVEGWDSSWCNRPSCRGRRFVLLPLAKRVLLSLDGMDGWGSGSGGMAESRQAYGHNLFSSRSFA